MFLSKNLGPAFLIAELITAVFKGSLKSFLNHNEVVAFDSEISFLKVYDTLYVEDTGHLRFQWTLLAFFSAFIYILQAFGHD